MERSANRARDIYVQRIRFCACVHVHTCVFAFISVHVFAHLWGVDIKITINDLHFFPLTEIPHLFSVMNSSFSPPLPDLPTLSLYCGVFVLFLFFPLSSQSLFLLCYTVEQWKSFLYPTHHSLVTINSIYVCLNQRVREQYGHHPRAPVATHTHTCTHTCEPVRMCRPHTHTCTHTSEIIHLLHNIIRISSSKMTHAARDRD